MDLIGSTHCNVIELVENERHKWLTCKELSISLIQTGVEERFVFEQQAQTGVSCLLILEIANKRLTLKSMDISAKSISFTIFYLPLV